MKQFSNYIHTRDNEQIYFATNFEHDQTEHTDVIVFNYGLVCSNFHCSM